MNIEDIRQQAQNENTAPERLAELASNKDYRIRQCVAANPNTPTATLLKLGEEFSRELIHNPIFDLLILEDIDFLNKIPLPTLRSILRQQDVPEFILEQAGDRAELEIQLALANKVSTSKKVLKRLMTSRYPEVVEAANLHIKLSGELKEGYQEKGNKIIEQKLHNRENHRNFQFEYLEILSQICPVPIFFIEYLVKSNNYQKILSNLAKSSATMPNIIEYLANCANLNSDIKINLLQNYHTSIDTFGLLVKDARFINQEYLASNPKTPVDILERLAKDRNRYVRSKVAENPNTPINILSDLAKDYDVTVTRNAIVNIAIQTNEFAKHTDLLAEHPNTPENFLVQLFQYQQYNIREKLAKNTKTPMHILAKLAYNEHYSVREKVAENIKTTAHILEELAYDEHSYVRWEVAKNLNTPLKILFKELIRNNWVNSAITYQLSNRKVECPEIDKIKDIFAEESASSLEMILQRLIDDGEEQTRFFLASRVDLPVNLLIQLTQKPEPKVQEAVAKNPNTPTTSLEQLASNKKPEIRQAVAKHLNTSSEILEILANDDNQIVRASAMSNPNLSKESIEQLLCDKYAAEYPQYNPDFLKNNPDSLALVLNYYAKSQSQLVSYITLLQPQVSQQILQEKSLSNSWLDRFAVAQNTNTSLDTLQRLVEDSNQLVRAAASFNYKKREI